MIFHNKPLSFYQLNDSISSNQFLLHYLLLQKGYSDAFTPKQGHTVKGQYKSSKCEIPSRTLAEQQRIVGILDEAFAGIATPKPTPKRTSKTPAPSSKATFNPSSPIAARGG